MQAAHCALVVALRHAPDTLEFAHARQHLEIAIALSGEYHKLFWSIFWKTSPERVKRRIRSQCNQLAFDAYSHMVELALLVNEYAAKQTSAGVPQPKEWLEFIFNLKCANRKDRTGASHRNQHLAIKSTLIADRCTNLTVQYRLRQVFVKSTL